MSPALAVQMIGGRVALAVLRQCVTSGESGWGRGRILIRRLATADALMRAKLMGSGVQPVMPPAR